MSLILFEVEFATVLSLENAPLGDRRSSWNSCGFFLTQDQSVPLGEEADLVQIRCVCAYRDNALHVTAGCDRRWRSITRRNYQLVTAQQDTNADKLIEALTIDVTSRSGRSRDVHICALTGVRN
ncbi:hypothetical protein Aduo_007856 [Ancylostoma duodenale]